MYPAGAAEDSNFHGPDLDLEGWGRDEREALERGRQQLKQHHLELFQLEETLLRIMAERPDEPPHPQGDQRDASEDQEFMSVRSYNRSLRHMWTDAASDLSEYPHALCAVWQGVANAGPTRAERQQQKSHSRYPSQHRRVNLSAAMSSMSWHLPGLQLLNMTSQGCQGPISDRNFTRFKGCILSVR